MYANRQPQMTAPSTTGQSETRELNAWSIRATMSSRLRVFHNWLAHDTLKDLERALFATVRCSRSGSNKGRRGSCKHLPSIAIAPYWSFALILQHRSERPELG